ncbi:hypothetical protein Ddye_000294 [Dipteronia dyeriana]|uniref:Uncharacterized protein n=1 Tax=Dipteronia dyeriana TaxID=168575 RepID=A0AAE0CS84_9ROSI|nr:hypothetical protein Ddye_000294 [Dipteronia dyeriana]
MEQFLIIASVIGGRQLKPGDGKCVSKDIAGGHKIAHTAYRKDLENAPLE